MATLLQALCRIFAVLPRPAARALGRAAGWVLGTLLRYRRREVWGAMRRAFPEKSDGALRALVRDMYQHLGLTLAEVARLAVLGRRDVDAYLRVVQDDAHRQLAEDAGGALLLMGHIGNWEVTAALNATLRRKMRAIVKPLKPAGLQTFVERMRAHLDLHLISFRGGFGEAVRALRRGEGVAVILDQNQRRSMGVFVDFLGQPACTSHGLAILSSMSGRPVYPVFDRRAADGTHEVHVLPSIPPPPDREPATLQHFTQLYTRVLEDIIRQEPAQWTWIHRRWRTRPKAE